MSCGKVALERAGIPVTHYYASEIDKYAIQVSENNHPDITQLGCVKFVRELVEAGVIDRVDLLLAGSPCQGFSFAGKQLAFDDPRSALFFEFVEILKILKSRNPDIKFLLENVRMKKEFRDIITDILGVEPVLYNSALVSAQNRERYYWCNWDVTSPDDKQIVLRDIIQDEAEAHHILSDKAIGRLKRKKYSTPQIMPDKTGTLNTKNNSGQLSYDKGTTLVYCTEIDGVAVSQYPRGKNKGLTEIREKCPTLTSNGFEHNVKVNTCVQIGEAGIKGNDMVNRVYGVHGKSPTLTAVCGGHQEKKISVDNLKWRKLTPIECERLQTLPDNYTAGVSNTQRYKMLGNGWTVDMIAHLLSHLPTLKMKDLMQ